jgi:site-specific DNA-methyltransferase (adenine-specific)
VKLYNGDCLEVMKSIKDKSIDAIITDPPYGTTACKWDSVIPFDLMWKQLNRIIKDNGAILLFGSEPFSSALRMSNINNYKYDWIWNKTKGGGFPLANKIPLKRHETVSVFYKKQPTYNPQKTIAPKHLIDKRKTINNSKSYSKSIPMKNTIRKKDDGLRFPISVIKFSSVSMGKHPTEKPVPLMEYLIKTYTNEQETVLDFTMGSGTTGVACCNINRDFIGIELDKQYFEIAQERIKNEL